MTDARSIYAELFKLASTSREVQCVKQALAVPTWAKVLGGAGLAGGAGLIGHEIGRRRRHEEKEAPPQVDPTSALIEKFITNLVEPTLLGKKLESAPNIGEFTSI